MIICVAYCIYGSALHSDFRAGARHAVCVMGTCIDPCPPAPRHQQCYQTGSCSPRGRRALSKTWIVVERRSIDRVDVDGMRERCERGLPRGSPARFVLRLPRRQLRARDSSRSRPSSPLQLCHPLGTSTQAQENIKNRYDLKGCDTGRALLDVHLFVGTKRSSGIWSTYLHVSTLSGLTALLVAHRELKTDLENSFVE